MSKSHKFFRRQHERVVREVWIPKWYFEVQKRRINDLERRVKRLELMCLEDAKNKIASLSEQEAGRNFDEQYLTIEEIVNQSAETGRSFIN